MLLSWRRVWDIREEARQYGIQAQEYVAYDLDIRPGFHARAQGYERFGKTPDAAIQTYDCNAAAAHRFLVWLREDLANRCA